MPNLTTALPRRTGDLEEDYNRLFNWAVSLTDELKSLFCNLDSGNVTEAGSIKAQNIDASQAKIKDAQIASLTADKLTAGVIDAGLITVKGENKKGSMTLTGESLTFKDKNGNERVYIGNVNGEVIFELKNADGSQGVFMTSTGKIYLTGNIETTQDCIIQGQLRVGYIEGAVNKGIGFYGKKFNIENDKDGYCGGIFPYVIAKSGGVPIYAGIAINKPLYLDKGGGYSIVVTENDLDSIKDDISELRRRINASSNE